MTMIMNYYHSSKCIYLKKLMKSERGNYCISKNCIHKNINKKKKENILYLCKNKTELRFSLD